MATTTTRSTTTSTTTAVPAVSTTAMPATSASGFDLDGFLAFDAQPRVVQGGGNYVYKQDPDGTITIMSGPSRVGEVHAPGTPVNVAITREIGPFPTATQPAPAPTPAPTPSPTTPAPAGELDPNLAAADTLAKDTTVPHTYSVDTQAGDPTGAARRDALLAGDTDALKTLVCSEFTVLSLQQAGIDLTQRYLEKKFDPALPVSYKDKNGFKFVDLYMVTNNQGEAAAAVLAAQQGKTERVEPGSARAKELGTSEATAFLHFEDFETKFINGATRIAFKPEAGNHFGAGATAISLGGEAVEMNDRRPGDIQQRWDTNAGVTAGQGHSSTVWTVRATGVAYLGAPNSPKLVPDPGVALAPGWYRVTDIFWELSPTTDPALVGEVNVDWVQLIDANLSTSDSTGVGKMKQEDGSFDAAAGSSSITSTGRLPSSKWLKPAKPAASPIIGTISKSGAVAP